MAGLLRQNGVLDHLCLRLVLLASWLRLVQQTTEVAGHQGLQLEDESRQADNCRQLEVERLQSAAGLHL